ncbi:phospholipase D-like domain-containing protein [Halomonas sp. HL-93]|uniref:phospholipase D-like domain-containing protein n=1 Tax=Halomonas sp. HL-93 TaxID=1666906 RepID=UPI0006D9FD49|nr:phospholipase D-like domain-containing protein [Halomonas sp. HL-93]KPQ20932.1 MAG: Phosphatidylserine/phosphatidylglycerophosphate/cardiolipin synthase family protein [Halomonas sp. HL-93]SBR46419.1 Phosphatidylserine/phosphatidylglycerophosphate/cardiolipin synthase [Halomonas sp. HL-93]
MSPKWRDSNRFTLLPEASRFLPAMLGAIHHAQHYVLVELYLMESGKLADQVSEALIKAVKRGVPVCLLLDGFGSMGLASEDRHRLMQAGVQLRFFNPLGFHSLARNLSRDHRKIVVVDGEVAFTGGFGAVDEFLDAWYEIAVQVEGPVVADWEALFRRLWRSRLARPDKAQTRIQALPDQRTSPSYADGARGRVVSARGYRYQAIRYSLHQRIGQTRQRLWLCTPYFVPTFRLRRRLMRAAKRGIDVRLLLPGAQHDHPGVRYAGQRFYHAMLKSGVRIYEFKPSFIHAKFVLADEWVSIGSCNFDHWNLHWNLEANQEVDDPRLAQQVCELFERHFAASDEVDAAKWAARPLRQRAKEWLYGLLDALVMRLK